MEFFNWIFFGPAKLVAAWEYAGILIGVALVGAQCGLSLRSGTSPGFGFFREAPVLAGLLWIIFNLYELQYMATTAQSAAGAGLRMDLVILVPILYVLTLAAILSIRVQLRRPERDSGRHTDK